MSFSEALNKQTYTRTIKDPRWAGIHQCWKKNIAQLKNNYCWFEFGFVAQLIT